VKPQILPGQVTVGQHLDSLQALARQRDRPVIPSPKGPPADGDAGVDRGVVGQVRYLEQKYRPVRRVGIASDHGGAVAASKPGRDAFVGRAASGDERHEPKDHQVIIALVFPSNEALDACSAVS
jgi:hypothetical protein